MTGNGKRVDPVSEVDARRITNGSELVEGAKQLDQHLRPPAATRTGTRRGNLGLRHQNRTDPELVLRNLGVYETRGAAIDEVRRVCSRPAMRDQQLLQTRISRRDEEGNIVRPRGRRRRLGCLKITPAEISERRQTWLRQT